MSRRHNLTMSLPVPIKRKPASIPEIKVATSSPAVGSTPLKSSFLLLLPGGKSPLLSPSLSSHFILTHPRRAAKPHLHHGHRRRHQQSKSSWPRPPTPRPNNNTRNAAPDPKLAPVPALLPWPDTDFRQLRTEFLPLYRARIQISVRISELEAYLHVFVQPMNVANIRIEICDLNHEVELRNAILLGATVLDVVYNYGLQELPMVGLLKWPNRYTRFYEFVEQCVDRVFVVPGFVDYFRQGVPIRRTPLIYRLDMYVKREFAEEWMERDVMELDSAWLAKWKRGLGLPDGAQVVPRVVPVDTRTELQKLEGELEST